MRRGKQRGIDRDSDATRLVPFYDGQETTVAKVALTKKHTSRCPSPRFFIRSKLLHVAATRRMRAVTIARD